MAASRTSVLARFGTFSRGPLRRPIPGEARTAHVTDSSARVRGVTTEGGRVQVVSAQYRRLEV